MRSVGVVPRLGGCELYDGGERDGGRGHHGLGRLGHCRLSRAEAWEDGWCFVENKSVLVGFP